MALTFADAGQLARIDEFERRVAYAMKVAAVNVYAEVTTVVGHVARAAYAVKVANGDYNLSEVTLAVLTNATILAEGNLTTTPGNAIPDGDIQFAVNSIWNLLAGA
jgi:hypothetical protein